MYGNCDTCGQETMLTCYRDPVWGDMVCVCSTGDCDKKEDSK